MALAFGIGTPSVTVFTMAGKVPSLWSHTLSVRFGAKAVPTPAGP
jgi:hypothetical protein